VSHIICTHCMTAVPHGATVCRGCKAEVEYGVSQGMCTVLSVASALLGLVVVGALDSIRERFSTLDNFSPTTGIALWGIAVIALYAGGRYLLRKWYKDRVVFNRIYRTR